MRPGVSSHSQHGVVLPIVLVVMMVVTMVIVTQVRRSTVDERLAGNWSSAMSRHAATESLVRYCEAWVINRPMEARHWRRVLPSENYVNSPAWADNNIPATDYIAIQANLLPAGATAARCVVEDATIELDGNTYAQDNNPGTGGIVDPYLWKYRFTVLATYPDASNLGSVTYRTQSEVRFTIP